MLHCSEESLLPIVLLRFSTPPLFEDFDFAGGSDFATVVRKCTEEICLRSPINPQSDLVLDVPKSRSSTSICFEANCVYRIRG